MYQSSTNWTDPFRHLLPLQAAVCCTRSGAAYNLFFSWLLLATNAVANALPPFVVVSLLFLHLLHIIIRNTICTAASECRCESAYNRYTHRIWEHIPHTHTVSFTITQKHIASLSEETFVVVGMTAAVWSIAITITTSLSAVTITSPS